MAMILLRVPVNAPNSMRFEGIVSYSDKIHVVIRQIAFITKKEKGKKESKYMFPFCSSKFYCIHTLS